MMKRQSLWTRVGLGLTLALLLSVATLISGTVTAAPVAEDLSQLRAGSLLAPGSAPIVDGIVEIPPYQFAGRVDVPVPGTDAAGPGNLFRAQADGVCYYAFVVDRTFNDNVYAPLPLSPEDRAYLLLDGWNAHKFDHLRTSDRADFAFKNPSTGATIGYASMDYLYSCGGSWCAGPGGNDINNALNPKIPVLEASSSMVYNLLNVDWPQKSPANPSNGRSPDYDFNDSHTPKYQWHMVYELSIDASEFGLGGACADIDEAGAHNSPYKVEGCTNCARLGDEVWHDLDADGVRDTDVGGVPTEPGFGEVEVRLYTSFTQVNGSCIPTGDPIHITQTDPAGFYHFENLAGGNYCVDVDEDDLPPGTWTLSTPPEPRFVSLQPNEEKNTVDFGYYSAEARISISPDADTNDVNEPHVFVILTEKDVGSGWVAAAGVVPTVTFPGGIPGTVDTSDCDAGTDANGECEVVINSGVAGQFTAHAAADIEVAPGVVLHRETDGTGGNSGDAAKTYVDARIELTPLQATNEVGDEHVVTATVQVNEGSDWSAAPDGTRVDFSLLNNTANAFFVGNNFCTTSGGSCSVVINANQTGEVDIHAATDVSVGGLMLHRETDSTAGNSGDAHKTYILADYEISKTLNTTGIVYRNTPVSFTICITNVGDTWIRILPMRDVYSTTYLTYGYTDTLGMATFAAPDSDDHNNDGVIDWSDLTVTEGDLAPGAHVTVIVTFTARADTTQAQPPLPNDETINTARVHDAWADPDGDGPQGAVIPLPEKEASDGVRIETPTAVEGVVLASLKATAKPDGVWIAWETATEVNILGFNVLRRVSDVELEALNEDLIPAQYAGVVQGAVYGFLDDEVVAGTTYTYELEVVPLEGDKCRHRLGTVDVPWWSWLPVVVR